MLRKFKTVQDMDRAQPVVVETDPVRLVARVTALCELTQAWCPGRFRGVHRFRDMEESNAFRVTWMRERAVGLAHTVRPNPVQDADAPPGES